MKKFYWFLMVLVFVSVSGCAPQARKMPALTQVVLPTTSAVQISQVQPSPSQAALVMPQVSATPPVAMTTLPVQPKTESRVNDGSFQLPSVLPTVPVRLVEIPTPEPTIISSAIPTPEPTATPTPEVVVPTPSPTVTPYMYGVGESVPNIMPSLIPSFEQNSQEVKNGIYKINRGSGFLVSRNLVLTALHCVNTDKNNVQLGTTVSAIGSDHVLTTGYVVKFDINNDLALIKLDHCTESQYKIFKIAAYDRPSNTGVVVAYGYPGVNVQDGQANLSYDYFKFAKTGLPLFEDWYQPIREQDVFVNLPGFSGGPILDEHNFIVGVSSHVGSNDGRGLLVSPSLVAIKDFLSQKTERIEELHISGKKYYIQNYCASDEITYENLSEKKPIMYSDLQEYMDGFLRISLQLVDKKLIINDFTPCSYNQKTISKGVVEVIAKKILQDETISIKSDNEGYFAEVETLNTSIVGINLLSQGVCFTINGKWAKSKIIDPLRQINLYSYMYGFKDEYIANFDYIRDYAQDELTPVNAMQAILNSQDIPYGTAWQ